MKANLRWIFAAALLLLITGVARSATYNITNAPGWNLIANQLNSPNGNNIRNVILNPPFNSTVRRFNLQTKAFGSTETYTAGAGWLPGTNILNPGDGLYFFNSAAASSVLTINGNPNTPVLPLNLGSGLVLVARQTNGIASITNILGYPPPNFTAVYRFNPAAGSDPNSLTPPNYTIHALKGGAWNTPPGAPSNIRVGESVWVTTNGSLPSITFQPTNQTVCPGGSVVFSASAAGTPPLSYQWLLNGTNLPGGTAQTFIIQAAGPANQGPYKLVVTNPFGSVTNGFTLTVGDSLAPFLNCPTQIVTSCRGLGGVKVSYVVGIQDNCDPSPVLTLDPPSGSVFATGTNVVVATGKDASGNTSHCTFTVVVLDNQPPAITCPPDRTVAAVSSAGTRVFYAATADDNCDDSPQVTCIPPSGSVFPLGVTPVTCIAKDASGNTATCVFLVTVVPRACCLSKFWGSHDITSPGGRAAHAMAYDPNRGKVVMFGGENSTGALGDTWEFDGTSWTLVSTDGPSARSFASMAYLQKLGGVVLFGGRVPPGKTGGGGAQGDTWLWDGTSWRLISVNGPPPRDSHAMASALSRDRLVLFGGMSASGTELGDTWEFDGAEWAQKGGPGAGPGPRQGPAMAYGAGSDQVLLFGGTKAEIVLGDTWSWNGAAWTQLAKVGPSARAFASMAYNENCDSMILFGGGASPTAPLGDTWEWNGQAWGLMSTTGPLPRYQQAMAHHAALGRTVLFGGARDTRIWLGDTWSYGADGAPPAVASLDAACGDQVITLAFSVPVSRETAERIENYTLSCGGNTVVQAVLSDDARIVWLYLAEPISGGCALFIDGVQDLCGRRIRLTQTGFECRPEPCARGSSGTEFWLTFPGNYAPDATNPPAPQLYIAGNAGVMGAVAIPGISPAFVSPFIIPAGGVATVILPKESDLANASDIVQTNAIHVVASKPVAVYGMNHIRYTTDAYLGLSTRALGQAYVVMGYGNEFEAVPELNGSQFAIATAKDATTVIIIPSATVGTRAAGVPYAINMMRGQTYQLRNTNDAPADLSGTIIVANQPIAVFGSHQCASIPSSNAFFCDYLVEQLPPADLWGQGFLTVPLATRLNGDTFRVMALFNGTTVRTNGVAIPGSLNQGKYAEFRLAVAAQITADKPILVSQYANSSDFDFIANSDPFMVTIQPTDFYSALYTVHVPTNDFGANYLNLTVPNGSIGQVQLDGVSLAAGVFAAIPGTGYSSARVPVTTGPHRLIALTGQSFGVVVYGWSLYDSYAYPAGACGVQQGKPGRFICPPETFQIQAAAGCETPVPDFTAMVGNAGNALFISQVPSAGTLVGLGSHDVVIMIIDQFGNREFCRTTLLVSPGEGSGLRCPQNLVTNCASAKGRQVFYAVSICNSNYTLKCSPPPGSLFPPGQTVVTCEATTATGQMDRCSFTITVKCTTLSTSFSVGTVSIGWDGNGVLQRAETVTGPWITISNAPNPFQTSASGKEGYFRVKD